MGFGGFGFFDLSNFEGVELWPLFLDHSAINESRDGNEGVGKCQVNHYGTRALRNVCLDVSVSLPSG